MNVQTKMSKPVIESVTLTLTEKEFRAIELAVANMYLPTFMMAAESKGLNAEEMRLVLLSVYESFAK